MPVRVKLTKRQENLLWIQEHVVFKVAPTEALIKKMLDRLEDYRSFCSPWFREPRHYPR